MDKVSCDFCGSSDYEKVIEQTDIIHNTTSEMFCIVECLSCGLNYLNPRPNEDEIGRYYSSEYAFHENPSKIKLIIISIITKLVNSPLHVILNTIPIVNKLLVPYVLPKIPDPVMQHFTGGRILDIGCGAGVSTHFWGVNGALDSYKKIAQVYGVEVSDKARKVLVDKGVSVYKALSDVEPEMLFEIIRMNWSLEHVHSPNEYFEFITNHLQVGSKAIITVPNYKGLLYRIDPACVEVPIHLYHFCKNDLFNYAKKYNLKVIEFRTFSYPNMFVFAAGFSKEISKSFSSSMKISEAHYFQRILSRLDQNELGNDMLIVLEKC